MLLLTATKRSSCDEKLCVRTQISDMHCCAWNLWDVRTILQGLLALSLSTLFWVPAFPEPSLLALPPGVTHISAEGQCVRC